jgi:hypothetical protein
MKYSCGKYFGHFAKQFRKRIFCYKFPIYCKESEKKGGKKNSKKLLNIITIAYNEKQLAQ